MKVLLNLEKNMKNIKQICFLTLVVFIAGCAGQAFEKARVIDTPQAYDTFLKNNADSEFFALAQKLREKSLVKQLKQKNTISAYENYLKNNHDGPYVDELRKAKLDRVDGLVKSVIT